MKELKTLLIVIFFTLFLYWGIEPFAHSKLHPAVEPANYDFAAEDISLANSNLAKAKKALEDSQKALDKASADDKEKMEDLVKSNQKLLDEAQGSLDRYTAFWDEINAIDLTVGDVARGEELMMTAGCTGCHGIEVAGLEAPMDSISSSQAYGVNPPDLSTAGKIYDAKFLAAVIKNPVMAQKLDHVFGEDKFHSMPEFYGVGGDINVELADMVAYLKSIAMSDDDIVKAHVEKVAEAEGLNEADKEKFFAGLSAKDKAFIVNRQVFFDACVRCHDMKYDELYTDGDKTSVAAYLGSTPPDLSMYIRSRSTEFLHNFINDTQKMLPATTMPRVGLTKEAETQVIEYMESIGDSTKDERQRVTIYIMIYFVILAVFAGL